jgi:7-keto-8-aminopelargonate synthetase-like enzyme
MNEPDPLQQIDRTCVWLGGRKLGYFSGCDYFRLASHPRVTRALRAGLKQYGLNVAASRMTSGNHILYGLLEARLAEFFGAEDALVLPSGYGCGLVVAQALAGQFSHVVIDERAHPALSDASRFLDCPVLRFRHRDAQDLARAVRRCGPQARLILLTDGMFSQDGSVAPMAQYFKILPVDAMALVDDAHGAGVVGRTGRGTLEHEAVERRRCIQTFTLSKAFGVYGGVILGTTALRRRILARSNGFVGSTPLPLPLVSAALEAVRIVNEDKTLLKRLRQNNHCVREALRVAGRSIPDTPGPILAVVPNNAGAADRLQTALLRAGIYPPFIRYPGQTCAHFRFAISSEHRREQLERLTRTLTATTGWAAAGQSRGNSGIDKHAARSARRAGAAA